MTAGVASPGAGHYSDAVAEYKAIFGGHQIAAWTRWKSPCPFIYRSLSSRPVSGGYHIDCACPRPRRPRRNPDKSVRLGAKIEYAFKSVIIAPRLLARYGTIRPERVRLNGCDNWVHINPTDGRAVKKLIRDPIRGKISYPLEFWRAFNAHLRPQVALDVGVNYGECLFSTDYAPNTRIFGVEANPQLIPHLEKSRAEHPSRNRMELVASLVSDQEAKDVPFFVNCAWSGKASAVESLNPEANTTKYLLSARMLDNILPGELVQGGTLLFKMDIEGYEYRAFRGFLKTLSAAKLVVGFVEFDSVFISAAGESPSDYFAYLSERFDICYRVEGVRKQLAPAANLGDLPTDRKGDHRTHTDLVLVTKGTPRTAWLAPGWQVLPSSRLQRGPA
jgi:FkbM family methyltransferase